MQKQTECQRRWKLHMCRPESGNGSEIISTLKRKRCSQTIWNQLLRLFEDWNYCVCKTKYVIRVWSWAWRNRLVELCIRNIFTTVWFFAFCKRNICLSRFYFQAFIPYKGTATTTSNGNNQCDTDNRNSLHVCSVCVWYDVLQMSRVRRNVTDSNGNRASWATILNWNEIRS